jgi:hypothetical protein
MLPRIFPARHRWLLLLPLLALSSATLTFAQAPAGADTAKWITANDTRWQAAYQRDIAGPFQNAVAELRRQYLASLAPPLAAATQAGRADEAAAWTAEREAMTSGEGVPATDDPATPNTLKALRKNYREQFARLDKQRFDRARALFGQSDAILLKSQTALNERNRSDEAGKVQQERDQLRAKWLQPPAFTAPAAAAAQTTTPGASPAPAKLAARPLVEKLLALGATLEVKSTKGDLIDVKSIAQLPDGKYTFWSVSLPAQRADQTPLEMSDYAILDALTELNELALAGENVTDTAIERLRAFHALQNLTLSEARFTAASAKAIAAIPELRTLYLGNIQGVDNEALKIIAQCRKLKTLRLAELPVDDAGLANLPKFPALEELGLESLEKVGAPGFAHLAECRGLKQFSASNLANASGLAESLAHCKNLEVVNLPGSGLKDSDIAPLGALAKLRTLDLSACPITGAGFASWPAHLQTVALYLRADAGVDDAAVKSIEHAFPKLEQLDIQLAASGFSAAGAAFFSHLRSLQALRITGTGVTDEIVAQIAHCDSLVALAIREGKLGDPGAAALARLAHLNELSLDNPPLTDAALKSFARCKELRTVYIGKDAPSETEAKFRRAASTVSVRRLED